jgi:hypothetical protein
MIDSALLEDVREEVQLLVALRAAGLEQAVQSCIGLFGRYFGLNDDGEELLGVVGSEEGGEGGGRGVEGERLAQLGGALGGQLRKMAQTAQQQLPHHNIYTQDYIFLQSGPKSCLLLGNFGGFVEFVRWQLRDSWG